MSKWEYSIKTSKGYRMTFVPWKIPLGFLSVCVCVWVSEREREREMSRICVYFTVCVVLVLSICPLSVDVLWLKCWCGKKNATGRFSSLLFSSLLLSSLPLPFPPTPQPFISTLFIHTHFTLSPPLVSLSSFSLFPDTYSLQISSLDSEEERPWSTSLFCH